MRLYGLTAMPGKAKVEEIAAAWAPYRTLATFYMWHVADGNSKP
jgi:3-methyladenine DNA glycosylase/8-oxoguanine DNA glycosylase